MKFLPSVWFQILWNLTKFQLIQTTHRKNGNKSFDFIAIKMWTKLTIFAFWTKIELNTNKNILYIKGLSVDIFNISMLYYITISIQWAIFKKSFDKENSQTSKFWADPRSIYFLKPNWRYGTLCNVCAYYWKCMVKVTKLGKNILLNNSFEGTCVY